MVKKNCVSVECLNNRDYVALVATADGFLRYWPSVFNEYLCVDIKYDVQPNDEISHLMYVTENHYLIFTSNGFLASVVIETIDDKVSRNNNNNFIINSKIFLFKGYTSSKTSRHFVWIYFECRS